jgi:opacity protein-like surface antigen
MRMRMRALLLSAVLALALAAPAAAQKSAAPPAAPDDPVSLEQALYLIRSTLLTLNDANRSGNYTVLHDLAAPSLQTKDTAADLSQSFTDLRNRHVDLYAVALLAPRLSAPPHIENKKLRLTGEFPTKPLLIRFDLLFEDVGQQWRMFGISVATPQAAPAATVAHKDKKPTAASPSH